MAESATRVIILGAAGRMGRMLVSAVLADADLRLAGAIDRAEAPEIGQDAGQLAGCGPCGIAVTTDLDAIADEADVLIEFTAPEATLAHAEIARAHRKPIVIGTTGLSPEQRARLGTIAAETPVFQSPNMSLGVNLLFKVLPLIARALGSDYDVEVIETHHHHKVDAPSGTALKLAEVVAEGQGTKLEDRAIYGRQGIQPRQAGEIGIHAVRAGSVVGDHIVLFANEGEQIEVTHRAYSRQTFVFGALRAAKWLAPKSPGFYTMGDLLAEA